MKGFHTSPGRPSRRFPSKLCNFHLPLGLHAAMKSLAIGKGLSMTELVQVSLARVLHAHGRPIPPDVEKSYTLALSEVEKAQQAEFDEWRRIKKESMRALRDAADAENRKRLDREAAMRQAQREARERLEAQERADREQYASIPDLAGVEVPEVFGVAGSGVAGSGVAGFGVAGSKGPFVARAESAPEDGAGSESAGDAANVASASQAPSVPADPGPALDPLEIL
jgi:hypothetical protein